MTEERCPHSIYKDDRHSWSYSALARMNLRVYRVRRCSQCAVVEWQYLSDAGGQAGDVWTTLSSIKEPK